MGTDGEPKFELIHHCLDSNKMDLEIFGGICWRLMG